MNTKDLTKNRGLLAIILSVAIIATVGGLSTVYAATGSSQTQSQTQPQIQGSINIQQNIMSNVKTSFSNGLIISQAMASGNTTSGVNP